MKRPYIVSEPVLEQIVKIAVGQGLDLAKQVNGQDAGKEIPLPPRSRRDTFVLPPWREPRYEQFRGACLAVKAAIDKAAADSAPARSPAVYGPDGKPASYTS